MKYVLCLSAGVWLCLAVDAWSQPKQWSDDFLTATTFDSVTPFQTCYGGPVPKYTMMEAGGDIWAERATMGPRPGNRPGAFREGQVQISNSTMLAGGTFEAERYECFVVGWVGLGTGCPGEPANNRSTMMFTSPDVCVYGAFEYNNWHLRYKQGGGETPTSERFGLDRYPGVKGVDDDQDGITDGTIGVPGVDDDGDLLIDEYAEVPDWNEYPGQRRAGWDPNLDAGDPEYPGYSTHGYGYPHRAGVDNRPGVAGVDDDGNGTTDDINEVCWSSNPGLPDGTPLTDDGDDNLGRLYGGIMMRLDLVKGDCINLNIDYGSGQSNCFSIRQMIGGVDNGWLSANEIVRPFYKPQKRYNYQLCGSGTCFGAQLWTDTDMANPNETTGPGINTLHPVTTEAGMVLLSFDPGQTFYVREGVYKGNSNLRDKFWVVSGNNALNWPSPSADLDDDKDVDGFDFLTFSVCYNGSNNPPQAACVDRRADLDKDGDVDGFDFLTFSNCYNGSNKKPQAVCLPANMSAWPNAVCP